MMAPDAEHGQVESSRFLSVCVLTSPGNILKWFSREKCTVRKPACRINFNTRPAAVSAPKPFQIK